jgi:hypothetical protein
MTVGDRNRGALSPAERQEQIANLLAGGILRLKESQYASGTAAAPSLDFSAETRLSGGDEGTSVVPKKASRRGATNTTPALTTTTLP